MYGYTFSGVEQGTICGMTAFSYSFVSKQKKLAAFAWREQKFLLSNPR